MWQPANGNMLGDLSFHGVCVGRSGVCRTEAASPAHE